MKKQPKPKPQQLKVTLTGGSAIGSIEVKGSKEFVSRHQAYLVAVMIESLKEYIRAEIEKGRSEADVQAEVNAAVKKARRQLKEQGA